MNNNQEGDVESETMKERKLKKFEEMRRRKIEEMDQRRRDKSEHRSQLI
jgi:hypothetical protein